MSSTSSMPTERHTAMRMLYPAGVLLLALLLTALLAPGQFETRLDAETGRHLLQAGSYQAVGEASLAPLFTAGEQTGFFSAFFDEKFVKSRFGRREEKSIRLVEDAFFGAKYSDQFVNLVIVGLEIVIANWPVIAHAIDTCSFEVIWPKS